MYHQEYTVDTEINLPMGIDIIPISTFKRKCAHALQIYIEEFGIVDNAVFQVWSKCDLPTTTLKAGGKYTILGIAYFAAKAVIWLSDEPYNNYIILDDFISFCELGAIEYVET